MAEEIQGPEASTEAPAETPAEAPAEAVAEESAPAEDVTETVVEEPEDPVVLKAKSHPYEPRQIIDEGKRISKELLDEIEQRRAGADIEILYHALLNERAAADASE